jgi:hypothetical protein
MHQNFIEMRHFGLSFATSLPDCLRGRSTTRAISMAGASYLPYLTRLTLDLSEGGLRKNAYLTAD